MCCDDLYVLYQGIKVAGGELYRVVVSGFCDIEWVVIMCSCFFVFR